MTAPTDYVVAPLTPAVGGLVSGLDLSRPLSERAVQGLREALAERHVLFFENQTLEPARLSAARPDDDLCRDPRRPPRLMTRGASGPARDGVVTSRK